MAVNGYLNAISIKLLYWKIQQGKVSKTKNF